MISIYHVAEWFLQKQPMSHKKIQKMCYYAVAWCHALYKTQLCNDTVFEAWVHGPVSPELYGKYFGNGWNDIAPEGLTVSFAEKELDLLESVYETYGKMSANELEVLSHSEPPWKKARIGCDPDERCSNAIDEKDMHDYYLSIYDGDDK